MVIVTSTPFRYRKVSTTNRIAIKDYSVRHESDPIIAFRSLGRRDLARIRVISSQSNGYRSFNSEVQLVRNELAGAKFEKTINSKNTRFEVLILVPFDFDFSTRYSTVRNAVDSYKG